jgi:hypothetical protein
MTQRAVAVEEVLRLQHPLPHTSRLIVLKVMVRNRNLFALQSHTTGHVSEEEAEHEEEEEGERSTGKISRVATTLARASMSTELCEISAFGTQS